MKTYIGCKVIRAVECSDKEYLAWHLSVRHPDEKAAVPGQPSLEDRAGYRVRYADGYSSWSPAGAFDRAYRELSVSEIGMVRSDL